MGYHDKSKIYEAQSYVQYNDQFSAFRGGGVKSPLAPISISLNTTNNLYQNLALKSTIVVGFFNNNGNSDYDMIQRRLNCLVLSAWGPVEIHSIVTSVIEWLTASGQI